MSKVKLTKPQIEVLRTVAAKPAYFGAHYPPLKKALSLGLVEEVHGRWSSSYTITDLGRAALAEEGRGE